MKVKYIFVPNNNQGAEELIRIIAEGYKIISAVSTKDGVQYVLTFDQE